MAIHLAIHMVIQVDGQVVILHLLLRSGRYWYRKPLGNTDTRLRSLLSECLVPLSTSLGAIYERPAIHTVHATNRCEHHSTGPWKSTLPLGLYAATVPPPMYGSLGTPRAKKPPTAVASRVVPSLNLNTTRVAASDSSPATIW